MDPFGCALGLIVVVFLVVFAFLLLFGWTIVNAALGAAGVAIVLLLVFAFFGM